MRPTLRHTLAFVILFGLAGCGDDPKPDDTGKTQSDDNEDGGKGNDKSSDSTSNDTDSDETGDTTDDELPEPVLDDLPPQTPLSSLDDEQLAEVCEAYLGTATSITNNLDDICPAQALIATTQSSPEDDAAAKVTCSASEAMCKTQVAASKQAIAEADCEEAKSCGATIADFNACNRQIAALNQFVIGPVGELDATECSKVTVTAAAGFAIFAAITVPGWIQDANEEGGGSPTEEGGPCERLREQCPELGSALDAFAGLDLPEF